MSVTPDNNERGLADRSQPASSAFGVGAGALFMAFFGFVWFGWGFSVYRAFTDFSAGKTLPAARWISFYVVFLILLGLSVQSLRLSRSHIGVSSEFRSRFGKRFRLICFLEGTACVLVVLFAATFHRTDFIAAGISFVVGAHFLPLARLFRMRSYFVAGIAVMIGDLLSVALFRGQTITLSVGIATGTVLWSTAVYLLFLSRDFLAHLGAADFPDAD